MTELLLRLFIKDYQNTQSAKVRSAVGSMAGFVGIGCNVLLFALKLLAGTLAGSVSITADAMNNLSDASSAIVTFLGFKLAEKPADEDHPYGHARYEYLSGLVVAAMILVIGFELAKTSLDKILHPESVIFSIPLVIVLVGSVLPEGRVEPVGSLGPVGSVGSSVGASVASSVGATVGASVGAVVGASVVAGVVSTGSAEPPQAAKLSSITAASAIARIFFIVFSLLFVHAGCTTVRHKRKSCVL